MLDNVNLECKCAWVQMRNEKEKPTRKPCKIVCSSHQTTVLKQTKSSSYRKEPAAVSGVLGAAVLDLKSTLCCLLPRSHGTSIDHPLGATSRSSRLFWCPAMAC